MDCVFLSGSAPEARDMCQALFNEYNSPPFCQNGPWTPGPWWVCDVDWPSISFLPEAQKLIPEGWRWVEEDCEMLQNPNARSRCDSLVNEYNMYN